MKKILVDDVTYKAFIKFKSHKYGVGSCKRDSEVITDLITESKKPVKTKTPTPTTPVTETVPATATPIVDDVTIITPVDEIPIINCIIPEVDADGNIVKHFIDENPTDE